jgi:anaerobic magnesium-protoporphyrin IX monomethyl ester cyclase
MTVDVGSRSNVLLINPGISECSQNKRINRLINISFPTSLGVIAGYLSASGIENVRIMDEQIIAFDDKSLRETIHSLQEPRIIGFSVLTLNCGRAYELAAKVKMIDPEAITVFGGIHPTVATEEVLGRGNIDVVVRGEGENTFKEMVHLILRHKDFKNILGISFRNSVNCVHNPNRPMIENLDEIPPFPYHLFENNLHKYPNFAGIFGSRGCTYGCTFCSARSISGRKYRYHSIDRVISECSTLVYKYKQTSIFLMDDNIAVNKKHFIGLCGAIIKKGLHKDAFFHGSMRGDDATEEVLQKAADANFKIIYYGLETGSERLMKVINKGEKVEEVVAATKRAADKGMAVGTTIIFGLPSETRKDRRDAMRLVRSLPLSSVRFNTLVPYPGTSVFNALASEGKILIKRDWENFGVQYMWESDDIPYVPDNNDRLELIFDTMWANLSFYLSIKGIRLLLTQSVAGGNVIRLSAKWFLSSGEIIRIASVFLYLAARFLNVTTRLFWSKLRKYFINETLHTSTMENG